MTLKPRPPFSDRSPSDQDRSSRPGPWVPLHSSCRRRLRPSPCEGRCGYGHQYPVTPMLALGRARLRTVGLPPPLSRVLHRTRRHRCPRLHPASLPSKRAAKRRPMGSRCVFALCRGSSARRTAYRPALPSTHRCRRDLLPTDDAQRLRYRVDSTRSPPPAGSPEVSRLALALRQAYRPKGDSARPKRFAAGATTSTPRSTLTYSTVTVFARLRGLSTSSPRAVAK